MENSLYIGMMSGTSMDGVDAVLARFAGTRFSGVLGAVHRAYPVALREGLSAIVRNHAALTAREWCQLEAAVAEEFSNAAIQLLDEMSLSSKDITAIGSHGQTVFHDATREPFLTLQLGDPNRIATRVGATVVADFRRRDLALGGQGAPLLPAFHHAVFASDVESRVILNLGGIANITLLPDTDAKHVKGFDTGPGNGLMDEWMALHTGQAYDAGGAFAASGRVNTELLDALLADPYFSRPPPKSTGRGDLHLDWVRARFGGLSELSPEDVQASLSELTARTVADAIRNHGKDARRVLVCGGGVRNDDLMQRIRRHLVGLVVESTDAYGLAAEQVEATAFAWFAARTINGEPSNLPSVTGASAATILGGIYRV